MSKRGGTSKGGGAKALNKEMRPEELNPEDSQAWSEDPSIYQRLADPRRMDSAAEELDDGYSLEEIQEFQDLAFKIRDMSESQTVPGVTTLYRGEQFSTLAAAEAKYKVGSEVSTTQLTSYATDIDVAKAYSKQGSPKVSVVITNISKQGDFVGVRMQHQGEKPGKGVEVITHQGLKSKVKSTRFDKASNTLFVEMENSAKPKKKK